MNNIYMESVIKKSKYDLEILKRVSNRSVRELLEVVDFLMKERETSEEVNSLEGLKPEEMMCFGQVADVIGEEDAKVQLQKVIDSFVEGSGYTLGVGKVIEAFDWENTPQGCDYWSDIHYGIEP